MLNGSTPLSSVSPAYLESLYQQFRAAPDSVDASWRCLFGVLDLVGDTTGVDVLEQVAGPRLAEAVRAYGHLHARLDPLSPPPTPAALMQALAEHLPPAPAPDLLHRYCGTLALETAHIDRPELRRWLIAAFEAAQSPLPAAEQRDLLHDLIRAEEFEHFLARKLPAKKRFGAEGAETVVALLRRLLRDAAAAGVTHVVIGSMHRGRLNIMANVLGRPVPRLLAEMKGAHPFPADPSRPGDVPYHLGQRSIVETGAGPLDVILLPNPSHLEAVDPVVLGRARALQDQLGTACVLPIVIHTDAAVIGQGVVAETLQLGGTAGFGTGGTVHLVINNRIGFTTEPAEARSSSHCTGAWKAVDSCILHVNGDDPPAAARAAGLAVEWRQAWGRDAVIDLVCYRRNGHNEIDEPSFTQPLLYGRIARHMPAAASMARRMVAEGLATEQGIAAVTDAYRQELDAAAGHRGNESGDPPRPARAAMPQTGVAHDRLSQIAAALAAPPAGMTLHPKMARLLPQRAPGDSGVAWPVAEALAFGSLLLEGVGVRLTGQDVVRGAFSHRHFSLVDGVTGRFHVGLAGLAPGQARFAVFDSPLSEYAVLGFEYGYSLGRPDMLVVWEAQFGDFANGAQIVFDQFIAAGEEKWCTPSALTVLLPHGLEGQGPEHSSARIERFLLMAAGDNMRIANPSTPANYFHLLRRQALHPEQKPLLVMSPKRLLRLPAAVSALAGFGPGSAFQPILASAPGVVTRFLLCSGKIAYELEAERERQQAHGVAVVRVEELYPFPAAPLRELFARWPDAPCIWVQEEPANMGAWSWLDRRLERVRQEAGTQLPAPSYAGRPESGSPAGSFHGDHEADQARIVAQAFAPC